MPGAACLIVFPLPNSRIEPWRMVVIVIGCTLFVMSQCDVIFTFAITCIFILHALSLFVVLQCVTVMNINYYQRSKLRGWSKTQHPTLTQCTSCLQKYSETRRTPSVLCQCSSDCKNASRDRRIKTVG